MFHGALPDAAERAAFAAETAGPAPRCPTEVRDALPAIARAGALSGPLAGLRTALSLLGALGRLPPAVRPRRRPAPRRTRSPPVRAVPTLLAALHRLGQGLEPVEPRDDLPSRRQLPLHAHRPGARPGSGPGRSSST